MLNSDSDSDRSVIMKEENSSDSAVGKKRRRKRKTRRSSDTDSSVTEKRYVFDYHSPTGKYILHHVSP